MDVVIGLVSNGEGQYLTLYRTKGVQDGVHFSFPGGQVKPDEPQNAAVQREIQEETGVLCQAVKCLGNAMRDDVNIYYWECSLIGGIPQDPGSGECSKVAFRSVDDIRALVQTHGQTFNPVVQSYLKSRSTQGSRLKLK